MKKHWVMYWQVIYHAESEVEAENEYEALALFLNGDDKNFLQDDEPAFKDAAIIKEYDANGVLVDTYNDEKLREIEDYLNQAESEG